MHQRPSRRLFLRTSALATTLIPTLSSWLSTPAQATSAAPVRLGIVGTGNRGQAYIREALNCPDVRISAICDTNPDAIRQALTLFDAQQRPRPVVFGGDDQAFNQLLQREDVDGVMLAVSDNWQAPMAIAAMSALKPVGMGLSATVSLAGSWALVDAFDQSQTPCVLLESMCYQPDMLAVLSQIRQGTFGEITYARSGYQQATGGGTPYPTRGIGLVANWININRGNQFISLSSTTSKCRGLRPISPADEKNSFGTNYTLGDVVTTRIECANGAVVELIHDSGIPRPYANGFRLQGTVGGWTGGEQTHRADQHKADSLLMHTFVESVRNKTSLSTGAYDAALWGYLPFLTEQSLASDGQPVAIPDFTRGKWQHSEPINGNRLAV